MHGIAVEWCPKLPWLEFVSEELELVGDSFNLYSPYFFAPSQLHLQSKNLLFESRQVMPPHGTLGSCRYLVRLPYLSLFRNGNGSRTHRVAQVCRCWCQILWYKDLNRWLDVKEDGMLGFNFDGLEGREEGMDFGRL
ncbi:hypothetical protein BT69DRAFT_321502 [Atractiella rhizophila]|nr:hypothetical protein BT69DRAFT_321502 [Atractiella rhizophila]